MSEAAGLPRVQPHELVARFGARGITIRGVGGMLHVSPADAVTPADRELLKAHKASLLNVLADRAEVI